MSESKRRAEEIKKLKENGPKPKQPGKAEINAVLRKMMGKAKSAFTR